MIGMVLPLVLIHWVRDSVGTKRVKVFSALSSDDQKVLVFLGPGSNNELASAAANPLDSGLSCFKAGNRCPRDKASVHLMLPHKHRPRNHLNKPSEMAVAPQISLHFNLSSLVEHVSSD